MTGHSLLLVFPTTTLILLRKISVFNTFKQSFNGAGLEISSTEMASICAVGWKVESERTVTSPERRKPKKQRITAAQSIVWSYDGPGAFHTSLIDVMIFGVMESRVRLDCRAHTCVAFMTFTTLSNFGIAEIARSRRPDAICRWRIAER